MSETSNGDQNGAESLSSVDESIEVIPYSQVPSEVDSGEDPLNTSSGLGQSRSRGGGGGEVSHRSDRWDEGDDQESFSSESGSEYETIQETWYYAKLYPPVARVCSEEEILIKSSDTGGPEGKFSAIVDALRARDVPDLRQLAASEGGLLMDGLRSLAWPLLLDRDTFATVPVPPEAEILAHHAYTQVTMDVDRSIKRFPPSIQEAHRLALQDQLNRLIMRVLIAHPDLHYYQGYHDICVTFLLILGETKAFQLVEEVSTRHLRLFMERSLDSTSRSLQLIPALIEREAPDLGRFLETSQTGNVFALSWVITWFSHVLQDYTLLGRLFDLFLVSDPLLPVYLSAALVLAGEKILLTEVECDMAMVHVHLSRLLDREEAIPFEILISRATDLLRKYPPGELEGECVAREEAVRRCRSGSKKAAAAGRWSQLIAVLRSPSFLLWSAGIGLSLGALLALAASLWFQSWLEGFWEMIS